MLKKYSKSVSFGSHFGGQVLHYTPFGSTWGANPLKKRGVKKSYGFSPSQASKNQKMEPQWTKKWGGLLLRWLSFSPSRTLPLYSFPKGNPVRPTSSCLHEQALSGIYTCRDKGTGKRRWERGWKRAKRAKRREEATPLGYHYNCFRGKHFVSTPVIVLFSCKLTEYMKELSTKAS